MRPAASPLPAALALLLMSPGLSAADFSSLAGDTPMLLGTVEQHQDVVHAALRNGQDPGVFLGGADLDLRTDLAAAPRASAEANSGIGGLHWKANEQWHLGLAMTRSDAELNLPADRLQQQGTGFLLAVGHHHQGLTTLFTWTQGVSDTDAASLDSNRALTVSGDRGYQALRLESGFTFEDGAWQYGPHAGFDAYSLEGMDWTTPDVNVVSAPEDGHRYRMGGRVARVFEAGGGEWSPEARVTWLHDPHPATIAVFTSRTPTGFSRDDVTETYQQVSLGLRFQASDGWYVRSTYQRDTRRDDTDSDSLSLLTGLAF